MSALLHTDPQSPSEGPPAAIADRSQPLGPAPSAVAGGASPWAQRMRRAGGIAVLGMIAAGALAFWSTRSSGKLPPPATAPSTALTAAGAASADADAAPIDAARSVLSSLTERVQSGPPPASPPVLPRAEALLERSKAAPGSPEARLLRVYALMAAADGDRALEEARKLAQDVPNFGLAHLVYADLLKARTAPLAGFGAVASGAVGAPGVGPRDGSGEAPQTRAERLKDLSAEARARVGGVTGLPPAGALPAQFLFISPLVRHAIAVDASRSRLYLFENTPNGLVLRRDYYASVGKLGTAKRIEGDLRTPLGVYFVTGRLPRAKLADRYGASAMVLNYPNQYDLLRGRTGSGIWLHGVESSFFSRAPLATDGCVALSNTDLLSLAEDVDRQATPVLIAERIDWVAPGEATKPPAEFTQAFEAWRSARQAADPSAELGLYADAPRPAVPASGANWVDVLRTERARPGSQAAQLTPLSVLAWHDQDEVMLVTYSETSARDAHPRVKRQYWLRQDSRWRIMFDGAVG